MNKIRFLLFFSSLCIMGITNAQTDSLEQHFDLKRTKFRLAYNVPNGMDNGLQQSVLTKERLQVLLSDNQFNAYNHARRCYIASIPLLSIAGLYTTLGGVFLGTGETLGVFVSYVCFGCAFACLVPGITLIVHSSNKLAQLVEDYNNPRYSSHFQTNLQIRLGFVDNGIGVKLNF